MAYSTSAPPVCLVKGGLDGTMPALWAYTSADAAATVRVTGYITNGGSLGMKVGDLIFIRDTNLKIINTMYVDTVSATYPGAVDLSDGVVVGSGTNSD